MITFDISINCFHAFDMYNIFGFGQNVLKLWDGQVLRMTFLNKSVKLFFLIIQMYDAELLINGLNICCDRPGEGRMKRIVFGQ